MTSGDSGTNQRGGWSSRRSRIAFTVFSCAILAMMVISSCRNAPPASENTGQKQPDIAQTTPHNAQQTTMAQMEPKRPLNKEERSCQKFVQEFYDWYTAPATMDREHPDRSLYMDDVLDWKPQLLDKGLFSLLKSDRDPSQQYLVKDIHLKGNRCRVPMMEERDGVLQTTPSVEAELERQTDHWVLYNFHYNNYPDQDGKSSDLRSLFKQWAEYDLKLEKKQ
jgi:hypothetical protein